MVKTRGPWVVLAALAALGAGCVPVAPVLELIGRGESKVEASVKPAHKSERAARGVRRHRALPAALAARKVAFDSAGPMGLPHLTARLAGVLGADVVLEERVPRAGEHMLWLASPDPVSVAVTGTVRELLDEVSARTGYGWEWENAVGPGPGRLVLYRYHDRAWAGSHAAARGKEQEWRIDPARHRTVRGVLEDWTARAGWTLVWEAEDVDYSVRAPATFRGTFEAAVDGLLRDTKSQRALIPTLWRANRYLTVREAG